MIIYYLAKYLMRVTLWVYYKRVFIEGTENIPKEGPLILASNHPNSFLDACVLGTYLPRELHFIARGDVFNSSWKQWILGKLQIIPIYRLQEGAENLEKNKDTFKRSHEVLNNNGVINIYSEGICVQEKRLRKLKKGTARIALDYVSEFNASLPVVAVGLNYMEPMKFRKELIIGISTLFDAGEIKPSFNENPALSIIQFNQQLTNKFKEVVIHIEDRNKEKQIDELILEKRNDLHSGTRFQYKNPGILSSLISYTNHLNTSVELPTAKPKPVFKINPVLKFLLQFIALPGIVLNGLPMLAAKKLTQSKVKLKEFKDSVMAAGGMIFSLIYGIIILITVSIVNVKFVLPLFAVMAFTGWISRWCYDIWTGNK
jgi:1-acyl-sn-glycerol-3-phosphate acyltransferase